MGAVDAEEGQGMADTKPAMRPRSRTLLCAGCRRCRVHTKKPGDTWWCAHCQALRVFQEIRHNQKRPLTALRQVDGVPPHSKETP